MSDLSRERLERASQIVRLLEEWDMLWLRPDGHGGATADAPWARNLLAELATILAEPAPEPESLEWGFHGYYYSAQSRGDTRDVWYIEPWGAPLSGRATLQPPTTIVCPDLDAAKSLAARLDAVLREGDGG